MRKAVVVLGVAVLLNLAIFAYKAATATQSNYARAKAAIWHRFPPSTRAAALRIAGCETGYTYSRWATGDAGERGLFQIHPSNSGRKLYDTTGRFVGRINFTRLYNIPYNVSVAYYMSRAGRDWDEWTCRRVLS